MTLRKALGVLSILLPFILVLGGLVIFDTGLQHSISAYYYTGRRDVFVGMQFAIGLFLLSYKGYDNWDDIVDDVSAVFAMGIAKFPATPPVNLGTVDKFVGIAHEVFSVLYLLTLAYFSAFLFTRV